MLTIDELSRLAGRNSDLLRRWVRTGRLPAVRTASGEYLLDPAIALPRIHAMPRHPRRRPSA